MLTVFIAEQQHITAIKQDNRLFFEPFLQDRNIVFCEWNPKGQTLKESVPGLYDAVGRTKEWRAVILHSCEDEGKKRQNPFDEVEHKALQSLECPSTKPVGENTDWLKWADEWKTYYDELLKAKETVFRSAMNLPLTKLSTWLSFCPADYVLNDVAEKKDEFDWALEQLEQDGQKPEEKGQESGEETEKPDEADQKEKEQVEELKKRIIKPNVYLESLERAEYKEEIRLKENIRREFIQNWVLNIARPSAVYCISERITENKFFDPENYWHNHVTDVYSEFADRNMYLDKQRFLVYDVLPENHRDYRNDRIRFYYTVMVFATNQVPGSAILARRLYALELDYDETPLYIMASSYDKKLAGTSEIIGNEIDKIRSEIPGELTDKEAEALFLQPTSVDVSLDKSCNPEAVQVRQYIGLSSNCPLIESEEWEKESSRSKKELQYIIKQQNRSVKKGIERLDLMSEITGVNVERLTAFQVDDIREYTENSEDEMIKNAPEYISDPEEYTKSIRRKSEEVKKVMRTRMKKGTTILLGVVALLLYLICFSPLIFNNSATADTVVVAIIIIGALLGLIALVMIITLFFLRKEVKNSIRNYNNEAQSLLNRIYKVLDSFSKFFSSICNVRRGNATLFYASNNVDDYTKSIRIRKKHQMDIHKQRETLKEHYADYILGKAYQDETMIIPYEYDFGLRAEYEYPAPFLAGDTRLVDFLERGNKVTVPSSFVKEISLRMEEIYDR